MFQDRTDAGKQLAGALTEYAERDDVIVLALPRGGVPIADEIATSLDAPLDVFLVRKLGLPSQPELAFGAIAQGGSIVLNEEILQYTKLDEDTIQSVIDEQTIVLNKRNKLYRGGRESLDLTNRIVILVDDGVATGATLKAAINVIKNQPHNKLVVAVPVGPPDTMSEIQTMVDEIVCLATPPHFNAISLWYDKFPQTNDEEVISILNRHNKTAAP